MLEIYTLYFQPNINEKFNVVTKLLSQILDETLQVRSILISKS